MTRVNKKKRNVKVGVVLWLVIHVLLIGLGCSVPWLTDSDLYSVLPDSDEMKNVGAAEKILNTRTVRNISVFVGHENFEVARDAAIALNRLFKDDSSFENTRLFVDENALDEMRDFCFKHRYSIQGKKVRETLVKGDLKTLKTDALQKIYSPFSMVNLSDLAEDPLLFGNASLENFVKNSPSVFSRFKIRDGMFAAIDSGITYVMWNAVLSENVPSMVSDGHIVGRLNATLDSLKNVTPGLYVAKSGIPFHSFESSSEAKREIAWISGISVVLILLLLFYVFRSAVPILATFLMIALAIFTAFSFSWFVFGKVHVFTFVFGTSVIGVSIDYAMHFFMSWKAGAHNVRTHIFKGILLGFLTTEFSYFALTFADFSLLRQMAMFSIVGLLSSFLTIMLLFHAIFNRAERKKKHVNLTAKMLPIFIPKFFLKWYSALPAWKIRLQIIIFITMLIPGLYLLNIHTDMQSLYTMSADLKHGELLSAKLNNLKTSKSYFIVEGNSVEDVLQREELFTEKLALLEKDSLLKTLAISNFIPSAKVQKETKESIQRLLFMHDSLSLSIQNYLKEIGIEKDSAFVALLAALKIQTEFVTPFSIENSSNEIPQSLRALFEKLWIGAVDGKYYSVVLPFAVTDAFDARKIVSDFPNVYVVNKMENVNLTLTKISRTLLCLVCVAYVFVFIILVIVYKFNTALKIIRVPALASLFVLSAFGYLRINFNFFAIVGVILTLGIGIDYALFFREGGRKNLVTALAIMLSATTTLISFGSLALSAFTPVATFGFAVLLGISCCFLFSPLSGDNEY